MVLPVAFIEKLIAVMPTDANDAPFIADILNQNVFLTLCSTYLSPLCLYFALYLFLPAVIVQLASKAPAVESSTRVSERDRSISDKNFYSMVGSNVLVTGLEMMFVGQYIYMLVPTDDLSRQRYYEDMQRTNFAFKILPQVDFFLRFLIQMIFISSAIQIFTTYIRRQTSGCQ